MRGLLGRRSDASAMDPAEVAAARAALGYSREQLAAQLCVTVGEVRAWEAGSLRVTGRTAVELRLEAAKAERSRLLEEAGLPECPWVRDRERGAVPRDEKGFLSPLPTPRSHTDACEACLARERYAKANLPPLPPPPAPRGLQGVIFRFRLWAETLPEWARPAAYGGGGAALLIAVRDVPLVLSRPSLAGMALLVTAGAAVVGACFGLTGGFLYRWTKPLAERGAAWSYLAGGLLIGGLALNVAVPVMLLVPDALWRTANTIIVTAGGLLVAGGFAGRLLHTEARARLAARGTASGASHAVSPQGR